MRFVYLHNPDTSPPRGTESAPGSAEKPQDLAEQRRQMAPFLAEIGRLNQNPTELRQLEANLGATTIGIADLRHTKVTEAQAKANPDLIPARNARLFLKPNPDPAQQNQLSFIFNARGNDNVENYTGAADCLPQSAKRIKVEVQNPDGTWEVLCADATRSFNPETKRIGYYDSTLLPQERFKYIPLHSKPPHKVTILETQPVTPEMRKKELDLRFHEQGDRPYASKVANAQLNELKSAVNHTPTHTQPVKPQSAPLGYTAAPRMQIKPAALSAPRLKNKSASPQVKIENRQANLDSIIFSEAERLKIDPSFAKAIIKIEAPRGGLDGPDEQVTIRFEPHIFNKYYLGKSLKNEKAGSWGKSPISERSVAGVSCEGGQSGEYACFTKAYELDPNSALKAISMGKGQIMGFNAALAGYSSPQEMFRKFSKTSGGEAEQIIAMFRMIEKNPKILQAARQKNYAAFAQYYNGAPLGTAKNKQYADLLAKFDQKRNPLDAELV